MKVCDMDNGLKDGNPGLACFRANKAGGSCRKARLLGVGASVGWAPQVRRCQHFGGIGACAEAGIGL